MVLHLLLLVSLTQTSEADYQGFKGSELELKLADLEKSYIVSEVLTRRQPDNLKSPLSQLHHDIQRFSRAEYQHLPRLADLKAKYPGERFSRHKGSWCDNVSFSYHILTFYAFIYMRNNEKIPFSLSLDHY